MSIGITRCATLVSVLLALEINGRSLWVTPSFTPGRCLLDHRRPHYHPKQAEQTMRNVGQALAEAGGSFEDVVRVRYILPNAADFEPCWPVLRRCLGEVRPAATMIVAGLADPRMKIEIEVTARRKGA